MYRTCWPLIYSDWKCKLCTVIRDLKYINLCLKWSWNITLHIHSQTCSENWFLQELPAHQWKMTSQLRRQLRENCWRDRKIFPRTWKRTKFRQRQYPLSHEHPLCSLKKLAGDGSQRTVRKPYTNYTNIMFANKMFASVYAVLYTSSTSIE